MEQNVKVKFLVKLEKSATESTMSMKVYFFTPCLWVVQEIWRGKGRDQKYFAPWPSLKFMPKLLPLDLKVTWWTFMLASSKHLNISKLFKKCYNSWWIIIFVQCDAETKCQSMYWKSPSSPRHVQMSQSKVMIIYHLSVLL